MFVLRIQKIAKAVRYILTLTKTCFGIMVYICKQVRWKNILSATAKEIKVYRSIDHHNSVKIKASKHSRLSTHNYCNIIFQHMPHYSLATVNGYVIIPYRPSRVKGR